jgi:hypothetical protein
MLPSITIEQFFMACCGEMICTGCGNAHRINALDVLRVLFVELMHVPTAKETMSMLVKLVDSNNAIAIHQLGGVYAHGDDDSNITKKTWPKQLSFTVPWMCICLQQFSSCV